MQQVETHYHFIGLGGIGMSGLAKILKQQGGCVSGSDLHMSSRLEELKELGVQTFIGHNPSNLPQNGVVIFSSGISQGNPELKAAREKGLHVIHRSQMLSQML